MKKFYYLEEEEGNLSMYLISKVGGPKALLTVKSST